jgi:DNA polymerase-1
MQVHDELILEVAAGEADTLARHIGERMTGAAELDVPLEVETGLGDNWAAAH